MPEWAQRWTPLSSPPPPPPPSYWLFVVNKQLVVSWQKDPIPTTLPHLVSAEYIYLIQIITLIHIQLGTCIIPAIDQIPAR